MNSEHDITVEAEGEAPAAAAPGVELEVLAEAGGADAAELPAPASRPEGVPDKFWDPAAGALRTDALLKSYLELERKLGSMVALPRDESDAEGMQRLRRVLGVPDSPDAYRIEPRDAALEPDAGINARLHEAGFTQPQAQLVYDLAAEYVVPMLDETAAEFQARRDAERLAERFGGDDAWRTLSRQIQTWGGASLPADVFEVLSSSYEGVLALHQMMQAQEPRVLREAEGPKGKRDEAELAAMMRDPRYWRDRDAGFVAEVTEGFRRLYQD